jgi:hypothetical protein
MERHYRIAAPLIAVAALLPAGCGEERSAPRATPDERLVRQQAERFLQVMEARQDAQACRMMTRTLQEGISFSLERRALPGSCRTRAAHIYSPAKPPGHRGARVKSVTVEGPRARATVTAPGVVETDVQLEKAGNGWKIANF